MSAPVERVLGEWKSVSLSVSVMPPPNRASVLVVGALLVDDALQGVPVGHAVLGRSALCLHAFARALDDMVLDRRRRLVEAAGDDLDLAGALQHVEAPQRRRDRGADRQQAVIAQHDRAALLAGHAQRIAFLLRRRYAILVIDDVIEDGERVLADR